MRFVGRPSTLLPLATPSVAPAFAFVWLRVSVAGAGGLGPRLPRQWRRERTGPMALPLGGFTQRGAAGSQFAGAASTSLMRLLWKGSEAEHLSPEQPFLHRQQGQRRFWEN